MDRPVCAQPGFGCTGRDIWGRGDPERAPTAKAPSSLERTTVPGVSSPAGAPRSQRSAQTRFPDGAGSGRPSDHRSTGPGTIGRRSGHRVRWVPSPFYSITGRSRARTRAAHVARSCRRTGQVAPQMPVGPPRVHSGGTPSRIPRALLTGDLPRAVAGLHVGRGVAGTSGESCRGRAAHGPPREQGGASLGSLGRSYNVHAKGESPRFSPTAALSGRPRMPSGLPSRASLYRSSISASHCTSMASFTLSWAGHPPG